MCGIVMEERQPACTRHLCERDRVDHRRVTPAQVRGILVRGVLRIVDQEVDVTRDGGSGCPARHDGKDGESAGSWSGR